MSAQDQGSSRDQSPSDGGVREPANLRALADAVFVETSRSEHFVVVGAHGEDDVWGTTDAPFKLAAAVEEFIDGLTGCGFIDCVNQCGGDFTHATCPHARAAKFKWQVRDTCSRAERAEFLLALALAAASPTERSDLARDEHKGEGQ